MNVFENKDSMSGFPDTVKTAQTSQEAGYEFRKLPGERKQPDLAVVNIAPRMRGCHY